jgi:hypothetical protein
MVVFVGAPAWADTSASSPDGGANGAFHSLGEHFILDDVKCDNHAVYIDWQKSGVNQTRINNTQGCNTPAQDTNLSITDGTSIRWKVCTNIPLQTDPCSTWLSDVA